MTEMQAMIAQAVERLFSERCDKRLLEAFDRGQQPAELGVQVSEAGFDRVMLDESQGGAGGNWTDAWPVLRGVGYWQVPLPLAETVVAAGLMSRCALALPPDAQGGIALAEDGCHAQFAMSPRGAGLTVQGWAKSVAWAHQARWLVASCDHPRKLALVDLHGAGIQIEPGRNLAGEPRDDLRLDQAPVIAWATVPEAFGEQPVWLVGALARCAAIVGGLQWLMDQSIQYANDRIQFGKPIGKNQAVQHALAELAGQASAALMATRVAFDAADAQASSLRFDVAAAKTICGEAATAACAIAHQVHGAIGFTEEHALHFATRRLWSWRAEFGSDAVWAEELGRLAIARGAQAFWPALTARSLQAPVHP
jgi:acyl-CoA dehydrogenase